MIRYIRYIFIILLINCTAASFSQALKQFSNTREAYLQEITQLLTSVNSKANKEKAEDVLSLFTPKFLSERFSKEIKDEIVFISNLMLQERMKAFPQFYSFIYSLNDIAYSMQNDRSVIAWLHSLEPLVKERTTKSFDKYLAFTSKLVTGNILYNTRTMAWRFEKEKYHFEYDTVPILVFEKLDLVCSTRKDSTIIEDARGIYFVNDNIWKGFGGRVNWQRVGLDKDKVYADILCDYQINLRDNNFHIDSVRFRNTKYLDDPILGSLEDKVMSSPPGSRTSYPRFESFYKGFLFRNVFEGINYEGGITMEGSRLIGSGNEYKHAVLEFLKDGVLQARVKSASFVFQEDKINSVRAAISVYHEEDSIHHPGLNLKYTDQDETLILYRSNKGISQSPFYDSYHKIDIYCEVMKLDLNTGNIFFEMIKGLSSENTAYFESDNFYSDYEYYRLQGIDPINPLNLVENYTKRYKTTEIYLSSFAQYINKSETQASSLLFNLSAKGFLVYNTEEKKATVKSRLFDYLDAMEGKKDYDVIKIVSTTNLESNAQLSMQSFDLQINGVSRIALSDSQNVIIYPSDEQILMKENRDFIFSGTVIAGLFDFYAKDCSFEYDSFRINLPVVDSLSFFVQKIPEDENEQVSFIRVKNVIAELTGDIYIDLPYNKSGLAPHKDYPIFNSLQDSYVFYDKHSVKGGVYTKDRFYYHVDPFTIKGLDNFSTEDMKFSGYLASGGIFPNIDEQLIVMPAYDLGFVHNLPDKGYPIYDSIGQFYTKLTLNNEGLKGEGWLSYLTSISESNEYNFYLDSLRATATVFDVLSTQDGVEFPTVHGEVVDQFWLTDTNVMFVTTIDNPFEVFENYSSFTGQLVLSPDGMDGSGKFNFSRAEVISDLFNFKYNSLTADTSDFRLLTINTDELAISTNDYKSFIDFDTRQGRFTALGRRSVVEFPFNKYISSMDEMLWDMDKQQITLINNISSVLPYIDELNLYDLIDFDFTGSEFISTKQDQDSLAFFCQKATYDMIHYKIFAEDVKIIRVADAAVFPGDGKITILEDAVMEPLEGAYIIADTSKKYHTFYDASVNIHSRNKFIARGSYDYIDMNDMTQQIEMNEIMVDALGTTSAEGRIPESTVFFLNPHFLYSGKVKVVPGRKDLEWEGGFSLNQDCFYAEASWTRFDTVLNPMDIIIPVKQPLYSMDNSRSEIGIIHSSLTNKFYPALFTPKDNPLDRTLISSSGILFYDQQKSMFRIGSYERLVGRDLKGNLLELGTDQCIFRGVGRLDPGVDLNPVSMTLIGQVDHYIIPDSTILNTSLVLDFYFEEKLLEMMVDSMKLANLPGVNLLDEKYKLLLINLIGEKDAYELINDLSLYGNIRRLPEEMIHAMVFTDLKLKWNPESSSYVSSGKIGIGNILNKQVNKYVEGYIEIEQRRSANAIHIYLELSPGKWYFFSYRNRVMQAYSSDQNFNNDLTDIAIGNRTINLPGEDTSYEYVISTRRKQVDFVRKMEEMHSRK